MYILIIYFLKANGHGMKERMNSFILFFKPIPIFNPHLGIESCIAGLLKNNYNIIASVEL